jgi:hypothetical protein
MRRIPVFVLVAAFIAGMAPQIDAYVRLGGSPKWALKKVTMQMQLVATKPALIDKSKSWNAAVTPGLSAWNAKMKNMQFAAAQNSKVSKGFPTGKNNVFFAGNIYGSKFGSSTLAVCIYTYFTKSKAMFETDVVFNTKFKWNSYRGNLRNSKNPGYDIRRVAIHEFGHALGLGHSKTKGAIMLPIISNQDKLGTDDINGAQKIYGKK